MARGMAAWKLRPIALSATAAALLLGWGCPLVLLHMCDFIAQTTPVSECRRDIDVVDAFGGKCAISKAFSAAGMATSYFDIETQGDAGDILQMCGFLAALKMVLKLREKGLLAGGPPCGSFIWMNRSTSKRSKLRIFGDHARQYVREANTITTRFILLAMVAIARGCELLGEQPANSLMLDFPYLKFMAVAIDPLPWGKVRFPMGAYGHPNRKPTVLFGTVSYMSSFARKLSARDKRRLAKNKAIKEHQMVKKTISKTGRVQVTGSHGMKASAAYPEGFGKFLAKQHKTVMAAPSTKRSLRQVAEPPLKAPYRWRHAKLADCTKYLKAKIQTMDYEPLLRGGLDD